MGARIYTFRCYQADLLYQRFQHYVNSVGEISILRQSSGIIGERQIQDGSHTEANHYQEQITVSTSDAQQQRRPLNQHQNNLQVITTNMAAIEIGNNLRSSSLSITENSLFRNHSLSNLNVPAPSPTVPCMTTVANKNIYMKQPIRSQNNSKVSDQSQKTSNSNVLDLLLINGVCLPPNKKNVQEAISSSLNDRDDDEHRTIKDIICYDGSLREKELEPYYINVNTPQEDKSHQQYPYQSLAQLNMNANNLNANTKFIGKSSKFDSNVNYLGVEQCENLSPNLNCSNQNKCNKANQLNGEIRVVNYIVLDLDNSTDSPLLNGSEFSLINADSTGVNGLNCYLDIADDPQSLSKRSIVGNISSSTFPEASNSREKIDSYSTIDFVRTSALLNQTNDVNTAKNEGSEQEEIESRLTRHSKYTVKSFNSDD